MRSTDFLARYGGDELTLIMRDSGVEAAKIVTQKIINLISEFSFKIPDSQETIRLGLTAGIATYPIHSKTAGDLLRAADSALYDAKKHRRGCYIVAPNPTCPLDLTGSSQEPTID